MTKSRGSSVTRAGRLSGSWLALKGLSVRRSTGVDISHPFFLGLVLGDVLIGLEDAKDTGKGTQRVEPGLTVDLLPIDHQEQVRVIALDLGTDTRFNGVEITLTHL